MNFSQKLGLFVLIVISVAYVYFSFFSAEGIHMTLPHHDEQPPIEELPQISEEVPSPTDDEPAKEHSYKTVKIYVADSNGNIRSVNRKCDTSVEKSCFAYAIKNLLQVLQNGKNQKVLPPKFRWVQKYFRLEKATGIL